MTRLLVADDHALIREGVKKILRQDPEFEVVGEAQTAAETLAWLAGSQCDILILDLALPDKNGLEVLKEVKARYPAMRVLVLSMYPEERYAFRALKAGADGYLTKQGAVGELVSALHAVRAGNRYVGPAAAEARGRDAGGNEHEPSHDRLSDRELQVLLLIGSGKTVSHIAAELNLSISTVNTHRLRILDKMALSSTAELIRYVVEHKLQDFPHLSV